MAFGFKEKLEPEIGSLWLSSVSHDMESKLTTYEEIPLWPCENDYGERGNETVANRIFKEYNTREISLMCFGNDSLARNKIKGDFFSTDFRYWKLSVHLCSDPVFFTPSGRVYEERCAGPE